MNEKRALTPPEVAMRWGIPTGTLANMRCELRGPRYYRVGRKIVYFDEDLERWVRSNPIETRDSETGRG